MHTAFQLSAALLGVLLAGSAPGARAVRCFLGTHVLTHPHTPHHALSFRVRPPDQDVTVDSGVTPYAPTYTGPDSGVTWGNACDLLMGNIIEVPDSQHTQLKAIGFYVQRDDSNYDPSSFEPFGAFHPIQADISCPEPCLFANNSARTASSSLAPQSRR